MPIVNEDDPKEVARQERNSPECQRLLRQFVNTDGPKGTTRAYRNNFDTIFRKTCQLCGTVRKSSETVEYEPDKYRCAEPCVPEQPK